MLRSRSVLAVSNRVCNRIRRYSPFSITTGNQITRSNSPPLSHTSSNKTNTRIRHRNYISAALSPHPAKGLLPPFSPLSDSASSSSSAAAAAVTSLSPLGYEVSSSYYGFQLLSVTTVVDLNLVVYHFFHSLAGAEHYHIQRDDDEAAFCITFHTPPPDSSGIAHILEHVVLQGSQSYPVPWKNQRSLSTYTNAITTSDYTMYLFSTQNSTDYDNLMKVYLDAVFFPLLRSADFIQNKAIVYNEMKGTMSDTDQLFSMRLQSLVFDRPDNVYHHNSGGEPALIAQLSYEQLKAFHERYYRSDNVCFCSYGKYMPPLEKIQSLVLNKFNDRRHNDSKHRQKASDYHPQPAIYTPAVHELTSPRNPLAPQSHKQTEVGTTYLFHELSPESVDYHNTSFSLALLSLLLLDGPASPLCQALMEPNMGRDYVRATGYDGTSRQPSFTIGLQGVDDADIPMIHETIQRVLIQHSECGFESERVTAILHQVEIGIKEPSTGFGIEKIMTMMRRWASDQDPIAALQINERIAYLKQQMDTNPQFFQSLIKTHLLNNQHRVTLIMRPDAEYVAKENARTQQSLTELASQLANEERQQESVKNGALLDESQATIGDASMVPTLSLSDIKKESEVIDLKSLPVFESFMTPTVTPPFASVTSVVRDPHHDAGTSSDPISPTSPPSTSSAPSVSSASSTYPQIYYLEAATNGCAYIRLLFNFKSLPHRLRPYFSLFSDFLHQIGAGPYHYRELIHRMDLYTGGINASIHIFNHLDDTMKFDEYCLIRGMSLTRHVDHLLLLFCYLFDDPHWSDKQRLKQLLVYTAAASSRSLQDSGAISAAEGYAASFISPSAAIKEEVSGITHMQWVNELVSKMMVDEGIVLEEVSEALIEIHEHLKAEGMMRCLIVGDATALGALQKALPAFISQVTAGRKRDTLLGHKSSAFSFTPASQPHRTFYTLPLQVNHVALVIPTVAYSHPDAAPLAVTAQLAGFLYLHRGVRVRGGAYACGATHTEGLFCFSSSRDPNHLSTLTAYHGAIYLLLWGIFNDSDIEQALFSLFGSIDAPISPCFKGWDRFLTGITQEEIQLYRDRLLAVTKSDIMRVTEEYLLNGRDVEQACIVGDETKVTEVILQGVDGWTVKKLLSNSNELMNES